MLKDFILNITLLISFFAVTGQIMKNVPRVKMPTIRVKIGIGVALGILGIILMEFTIQVTSTLIADMRHIAIIIAALYGGVPAAMMASGIIAVGRITLFPWSDASVLLSMNMILIGMVCSYLSLTSFSRLLKSLLMNLISLSFITLTSYLIIEDKNILMDFIPYHYTTSLVGGLFAFYLVEYIILSNDASRRIKESEERYRRLVIQSPDPMIIHDGEMILFANDKATDLLGVDDYNKIVGKSIYDFMHAEYHEGIANRVKKTLETEQQDERAELKINSLDGREIDIEISSNFITYRDKPASQVTFRDISERKRLEEALKENEERYRFIADNSTDLIALLSAEGKTLYNSPACKPLLGYNPHELTGRSFFDLIHSDDVSRLAEIHFPDLADSDSVVFSYRVLHKNRRYIWLETTARTIRNEDQTNYQILTVSRNITERKRVEEKLLESNRLLEKLSTLDGLTGIPNRRHFDNRLKSEWSRATRAFATLSIIMLDIDYFKTYNDTYGHQTGDDCLIKVAKCLQETVNRSGDFVARYGGEEFVVILPDTDSKGASIVAEMLRKKIEELEISHTGSKISNHVTISLGIASKIPVLYSDPQELLAIADKMLYQAKQEGRNRYVMEIS